MGNLRTAGNVPRRRGSGALPDLAAADTTGADQHPLDAAANLGAHFLQIGVPSALGFVVGVADVVAHRGLLAANRAMSHLDRLRFRECSKLSSDHAPGKRGGRLWIALFA